MENPFYKSISQKIKNITYQNWVKYFSHSISRTSHKLAFFKKKLNGFLIPTFSINKFDNADSNIPQEKFLEGKFPLEWHTLNKVELQVTLSYLGISEKIVTKDDIYAIRSNEFKNEDNIYGYGYYIRDFFTKNIENVKFMWDITNCEWCFNY